MKAETLITDKPNIAFILLSYKRYVLTIPAIIAALAYVGTFFLSPVWQASVLVKVGQVGQASWAGDDKGRVIEPIPQAIERMNNGSFKQGVLTKLGFSSKDESRETEVLWDSLAATQKRGTDLIEVSASGLSPEKAKRNVEVAVKHIETTHGEIAAPMRNALASQLVAVNKEIEKMRQDRQNMTKLMIVNEKKDAASGLLGNMMLTTVVQEHDKELRELWKRSLVIEEQMGPARTYATGAIESVYVKSRPVAPRKIFIAFYAGMAALLLVIVAVLVWHFNWLRQQSSASKWNALDPNKGRERAGHG